MEKWYCSKSNTTWSVSYTHLDVYKRQFVDYESGLWNKCAGNSKPLEEKTRRPLKKKRLPCTAVDELKKVHTSTRAHTPYLMAKVQRCYKLEKTQ